MKLYPDPPRRMVRVGTDTLVAAWTLALAAAGVLVFSLVDSMQRAGTAMVQTGQTFNTWLHAFENAIPGGNLPFVGTAITDYATQLFNSMRSASGDQLIQLGNQTNEVIRSLAITLGLVVALVPVVAVTVPYVVFRLRESREMTAAEAMVREAVRLGHAEELRALLALRAASTLSFRRLAHVTSDPVGDLRARRYEPLASAMLRETGLRPDRLQGGAVRAARPAAAAGRPSGGSGR